MENKKRAVFVTGGATGTGLAIAKRFAKEGYGVFLTSRAYETTIPAVEEISREYGVYVKGFQYTVGNEQEAMDIFNEIDQSPVYVETVVLNAADLGFGNDPAKGLDFFTMDISEFRQVLETNLIWNFTTIRQAAIRMKERGKGAIVFIGSNTAIQAIPNRAAYCASKGGMLSLSRALAVDLGKYGIRSNVVMPGTIKTKRWRSMGKKQIVNGRLCPIGDISEFEDIANAAYFLGSDESRNITGTDITVDGGMTSQLYPSILNDLLQE